MARRRSSKNDEGLGCLFLIFEVIIAAMVGAIYLLRSKNPEDRAKGWTILIVLAVIILAAMIFGN